ncbi:MAG: SIMPL domain-containing protein [Parvularculaceae bacterium]
MVKYASLAAFLISASALTAPAFAAGPNRTISLSSSQTTIVKPSEASIQYSISFTAPSAAEAQSQLKASQSAIKAAVAAEGGKLICFTTKNINTGKRTRNERVYRPEKKQNPYENIEVTTYTLNATQSLAVDAAGSEKALKAVMRLDDLTNISNILYSAALSEAEISSAQIAAVVSAERTATTIAQSNGFRLGKPTRINVSGPPARSLQNYDPEKLSVVSSASVTYELLDQ